MESIKFIFRTLQRNNFAKSTVKFLLPGKIANNIKKHFNEDKRFKIYFENKLIIIDQKSTKIQGIIPVFYWDGEPNFGDTIGPFLISNITGKPVLNIYNNKIPGLMAVGSIIQLINRKNMTIWGSGLIEKPTDKLMKDIKKYNPKVLSVRGKETAKVLLEAGITIPDESVFGDPALILPLFYKPITSYPKKIGICFHYIHKAHFLTSIGNKEHLNIIDVQKDMKTVINEINSSTVCISTSLHGLIIAQAYNIPWVWLEIFDKNLTGDDFKFKDFFSTINKDQVSHIQVSSNEVEKIDYEIIAKQATLPDKLYNEDLILEALNKHLEKNI